MSCSKAGRLGEVLLDTATLLWISHDSPKLSPSARAAYADRNSAIFVSVVSLWEIIVKNRLGKLPLPTPIDKMVEPLKDSGAVTILPLTEGAVLELRSLPDLHRDPFDRMLICQAIHHGLTLLTPDSLAASYPVATMW